ncbi:hypothetical protein [Jiella pelagia]|uniref:Uncharacterized protein n=1 Tax=Jiella pelagia TaxID=2986949 RepID=A0ABY7C1Y0_9HYPH|nr:hypothetical protein [Jiella pelagia]WAP70081.1 hypothetical protein OH818_08080 [Jiella pelagia]
MQLYQTRVRSLGKGVVADADSYRWQHPVSVYTEELSVAWRRAICAAEALSFVAEMGCDPGAKRLRLTFGNGHGLAAGIDRDGGEEIETVVSAREEEDDAPTEPVPEEGTADEKRRARIEWWKELIRDVASGSGALFDHPAIVGAVLEAEDYVRRGRRSSSSAALRNRCARSLTC